MEYITNKKNKSKCVIMTKEEFDSLGKEVAYYKKTIEELQDELDSIEAEKIQSESKGTIKFRLEDYVSDRDRINCSKSFKKTSLPRQGKNRKVYSRTCN